MGRSLLYRVEMTDLAEEDLESIGDYIAFELKAPAAALDIVKGIREMAVSLQRYPERYGLDDDDELARLGIRKAFYRRYRLYYVVRQDTVTIVRILHVLTDSARMLRGDLDAR